ncbi:hypothetical protein J4405_06375 [Candidatus Woesearchaeota archaeon]|nr:hypothetical protein [Candidatus Woesearchaeota archaeon]
MVSLYQILKEHETDFLELREKFGFGREIGYGSLPVHHHWKEDSMPFTALSVRRNKRRLEIEREEYSPYWDIYDASMRSKFSRIPLGITIVRPIPSPGGYFISAYMYRTFIDRVLDEEIEAFFDENLDRLSKDSVLAAKANELSDASYVLPVAFTQMPSEVFRGGLALMLGSIVDKLPEKLKGVYSEVPHAEADEALALCVYLNETENVRRFLNYWEIILEEQNFPKLTPEKCELRQIIHNLSYTPEFITNGIDINILPRKGEIQDIMLRNIKVRKAFLNSVGLEK